MAEDYFQKLYSSQSIDPALYQEVFSGFAKRVTTEMNHDLTKRITEEEVQEDLFDIGPYKAPGPDGFSTVFYQKFWMDLKPEIMEEVQNFFELGVFDQQHNHTNLCLIPKVYPPTI